MKDSSRHIILGTQQFKPVEFAQQINLSMDNAWGIVRWAAAGTGAGAAGAASSADAVISLLLVLVFALA